MSNLIIRKPVISEKSIAEAQAKNIYLFEVDPRANKHQISAEIERMYSVTVELVRTVKQASKKKHVGRKRIVRYTTPKKKAFVHVKAGQKIAVFDIVEK